MMMKQGVRAFAYSIVVIFQLVACWQQSETKPAAVTTYIQPLHIFDGEVSITDSITAVQAWRYFLVDSSLKASLRDSLIDRFTEEFIQQIPVKDSLHAYTLSFYKTSHITNETHLKQDKKDFDRYSASHDFLVSYSISEMPRKKKRLQ